MKDREGYSAVGRIESVSGLRSAGLAAEALIYPEHAGRLASDSSVRLVYNERTPAWVVKTLFPPPMRAKLLADIERFAVDNRAEFIDTIWPDLKSVIDEAFSIIEEDFLKSLEARGSEIDRLLEKHKAETFRKEILPVLRREAWPVIREESAQLVDSVGRELWDKLPMGSLGLRWMAEKVPFTDDDLVRKRFNEYVEKDALPIIESHTGDFVDLAQKIFARLSRNPEITSALRRCLSVLAADDDCLRLLDGVFRDVFAENERLVRRVKARLSDPGFLGRISAFLEKLTPLLNSTADSILLNEARDGINPELVRVLRSQLFMKDASWFLVEPGEGPAAAEGSVFDCSVFKD